MNLDHKIQTVSALMEIPLDRNINPAANGCDCVGKTKELIFNQVHTLFLKAHAEASKEYNPNLNQVINGPFVDEYWKAACTELETLEGMGAWGVVYLEDDMDVIIQTWYLS